MLSYSESYTVPAKSGVPCSIELTTPFSVTFHSHAEARYRAASNANLGLQACSARSIATLETFAKYR